MLKIIVEKWDKNKDKLKKVFETQKGFNDCDYKKIVETVFRVVYNEGEDDKLDIENITEIDNGHYQGTLLYLIPFDTYQPSESEYLMTYIGYGSCSVCDTLLSIQGYSSEEYLDEEQINDFMKLAKDILQNTIKPYNHGWRSDERFEQIELEEKQRGNIK